jgi:hypothetical protein
MSKRGNSGGIAVSPDRIKRCVEAAERFAKDIMFTEADLIKASPVDVTLPPADLLEALTGGWVYENTDKLNVVTEFHEPSVGVAKPDGMGVTKTIVGWIGEFQSRGVPSGRTGAWIRPNPVDGKGISDVNVTKWAVAILEADWYPKDVQLRILAQLDLPIVAIVDSGGKSLHAWINISARDLDRYRYLVGKIYGCLEPLGFDPRNKNPSRLSRLFGAHRELGAQGNGLQRLLYLNPEPSNKPLYDY